MYFHTKHLLNKQGVSPSKHPFTHGANIFIILAKTQHHLTTEQTTWINPQLSYISSYSQTRSCDEDFNLKRHYEKKHRNFEETFPQNSEVRTTKINALKSSYQAASRILVTSVTQWNKIMHDWSEVWRQTKRGNIQLCILIYVKMEMTFYFSSYFVVLNEKDILFQILQYYCMWPDWPQYMDVWVIDKKFVAL